jgi:hypothetical protein
MLSALDNAASIEFHDEVAACELEAPSPRRCTFTPISLAHRTQEITT